MIRYRGPQSHRSYKCWNDLKKKLPALPGGNVPMLVNLVQRGLGGISVRRSGQDWCPQPCTRHPSRHHRASLKCDSAKGFGQSRTGLLPWAEMLGSLTQQVNEAAQFANRISPSSLADA